MSKASAASPEKFAVFLRAPYNYDTDAASDESGLSCPEPTRAKQEFLEESDINTIVKRFGLTGQLPEGVRMPTYGDFTGLTDMHGAVDAIRLAQESFMTLPADIRARFDHNAARFVDFCSNASNRAEAESLGLVAPTPLPASAVPVAAPSGKPEAPSAPATPVAPVKPE